MIVNGSILNHCQYLLYIIVNGCYWLGNGCRWLSLYGYYLISDIWMSWLSIPTMNHCFVNGLDTIESLMCGSNLIFGLDVTPIWSLRLIWCVAVVYESDLMFVFDGWFWSNIHIWSVAWMNLIWPLALICDFDLIFGVDIRCWSDLQLWFVALI
jgi:hypothetical protein